MLRATAGASFWDSLSVVLGSDCRPQMADGTDKLTRADPGPRPSPASFATRTAKAVHNADEIMAEIVAKRLVEHLERAGFVIMKRPPIGGSTPPYRAAGST